MLWKFKIQKKIDYIYQSWFFFFYFENKSSKYCTNLLKFSYVIEINKVIKIPNNFDYIYAKYRTYEETNSQFDWSSSTKNLNSFCKQWLIITTNLILTTSFKPLNHLKLWLTPPVKSL